MLCFLVSYGQQRTEVVLNWVDNVSSAVGTSTIIMPQFTGGNMDYNADKKQLFFVSSVAVGAPANANSLQLSNIIYESITREQLGGLSISAIPATESAVLSSYLAREQWYVNLKLSPIIKDGAGFKRIKSFSYSYITDASGSALRGALNTTAVSNSVLASGDWYRFYVEKSGVYKLTRSFLSSLGLDVNTDPRKIKIYGNGGRMLPLLNSTDYPMDLAENAVKFVGEEDGKFDNADYILFYAEGVDNWNAESQTNNNLFADKTYYYVTTVGNTGKRIQQAIQPTGTPNLQTGNFDEYLFHEEDLVSIARLGRKWHGEQFNVENLQEFDFKFPDAEGPITVKVSAAANATTATSMEVKANDATVGSFSFLANGDSDIAARDGAFTGTFTGSGDITIALNYSNSGNPSANAWLDYIILEGKRTLKGNSKQFRFRLNSADDDNGVLQYNFTNASGIAEVWDITDIYNTTSITNTGGQANFSFKANRGEIRQYISVVSADYYTPLRDTKTRVANQNLKGTVFNNSQGVFQDVDYIIVTPEILNASAETLANLHRTGSGLNVKVVNLESIYQEFSSGKQDVGAIRNFVKYVYSNASTTAKRIKYLNLFGDASFDYKNRIPNNTNVVPTFHGFGSGVPDYSEVLTFVSDDFYGLMDPTEGPMTSNDGLDVAVGRMLVNDKTQADQMVAKVAEYMGPEAYGRWRNEYIMISDDVDATSDDFVPTLEDVAHDVNTYRPFINVRKVYTDAFVQQSAAGGFRYPEAHDELMRNINNGALVVNYLGHGGENGMAGERIFEISDAQKLTNRYKYPLFITATCQLTKFDNPYKTTAGEYIYWNTSGGAIAMITTTRSIFISVAFSFNKDLSRLLYNYTDNTGLDYPTMAEALRRTKLVSSQYVRCVSFIGDPALKLAIPKPKIVLTTINDVPVAQSTDVLQSLSYVKLGGRVTDGNGSQLSNYNGELEVSVFDKPTARVTLGNDGTSKNIGTQLNPIMVPIINNFSTLGETIFRGNVSVTNGQFSFGFVVPRDIRIPVSEGRVSFYSKRNNVLEDQTGQDTIIKIGGVNINAEVDNIAPTVKLYMNDESFVAGGITNESPILLAFLADAHGINTASGIGHDIIGILDGDETNPYLMNDYYEASLDDYTTGTVRFPFVNLAEGLHTLTFKAWDVYNNLVTTEIQFVVASSDELKLEHVLNYPNPFVSYTEFWFSHNRPFELLDVQVQIFTVTGKIVKTINQSVTTDGFLCRDIKWDGRDDFGDKIGKGVYVYKLTVRSSSTNKRAEKYEKLVLL